MHERQGSDSLAVETDAGCSTVGRLLLAGVGAGAVIGGVTGAVVGYAPDSAVESFVVGGAFFGGLAGMVAGLVTQSAASVLLLLALRLRPRARPLPLGVVVAVVPVLAAGASALWVGQTLPPPAASWSPCWRLRSPSSPHGSPRRGRWRRSCGAARRGSAEGRLHDDARERAPCSQLRPARAPARPGTPVRGRGARRGSGRRGAGASARC